MSRHDSTRSFFREVPNDLLARYYEDRGVLGDFEFAELEEAQLDELFAAWLELSEEDRQAMEAEFREILEMSSEHGAAAILDEARWQWRDDPDKLTAFTESFSALPGHYDRAMAACLDHPECRRGPRALAVRSPRDTEFPETHFFYCRRQLRALGRHAEERCKTADGQGSPVLWPCWRSLCTASGFRRAARWAGSTP